MSYARISMIVAMDRSGAIGYRGDLPWPQIKSDQARFARVTMGHIVIMGRKTWESLPDKFKPLPGRTNIILTRNRDFVPGYEDVVIATSPEDALEKAKQIESRLQEPEDREIFIIGGAEVYKVFDKASTRLYLTLVDSTAPGDVFFHQTRLVDGSCVYRETDVDLKGTGKTTYEYRVLERV